MATFDSPGKRGKTSGERAARDENGRRTRVPADMNYRDWKAVYIDKSKTFDAWQKEMEAKYAAMPPTREQLRGREIIDKLSSGAPLTSIKPNDKVSTKFDLQRFGTYEENKKIFAHHDFETGIKRITKTKIIETSFAITELVNQKGGVTRNFYDENGRQYLQISNNDHGNIAESNYGEHGEHAHDYVLSPEGKTISRTSRELYDFERERNSDIL